MQNELMESKEDDTVRLRVAMLSEKASLRDLLTDYLVGFAALEGVAPADDRDLIIEALRTVPTLATAQVIQLLSEDRLR